MGPMIDMVFLLLVFFIVTARPEPDERDVDMALPGSVAQAESLDIPDEQRVVIAPDGSVVLNDLTLAAPGDRALSELIATLTRFKKAADLSKSKAMITLDPHDAVAHERIVEVMAACNQAGIGELTIAGTGGGAP